MRPCIAPMACLVLAALAAAGCASRQAGPAPAVAVQGPEANQGRSWEVVLPGGGTTLAMGPEAARRDDLLGDRAAASVLDEGAWPDPRADRLDRLRRVYLFSDPRHLYYFRAGPPWQPRRTPYLGW